MTTPESPEVPEAPVEARPPAEWLVLTGMVGVLLGIFGGWLLAADAGKWGVVGIAMSAAAGLCFLFCVIAGAVSLGIRMANEHRVR